MKVLELFAGTRSIGKAFEKHGHEVYSVEWNKDFENIDLYADIGQITAEQILESFGQPDVIWASPDCATYSIARIWSHRKVNPATGELEPISEYAKFCDNVNKRVLELIEQLKPKYFFIENPRGGLRKMPFMQGIPRYTVTYCQYGDTSMKPTDIWTNHPMPNFKPMCRNGDSCHVAHPRGTTLRKAKKNGIEYKPIGTTTQKRNATERAKIPGPLCEHIVNICEGNIPELPQLEWRFGDML